MASILAQSLTRCYGRMLAVDRVSFEVDGGTVLGFLGPNGAGKSTTMKMLTGYLSPTSGTALINGYDIRTARRQAHQALGYLPEGAPLYDDMRVGDFLGFVAAARGLARAEEKKAVGAVAERLGLNKVLSQSIGTLSKGFGRRVGIAQALIHDPPILILDEPTDGLDPIQKAQVRRLIQEMADTKIIIISTHILEEVELLCHRVMIIAHGRLQLDDTPAGVRVRSRYAGALSLVVDQAQAAASKLSGLAEVGNVEYRAGKLTAFPSGEGDLASSVQALIQAQGWCVREFHLESGRLDDVFAKIASDGDLNA